MILLVNFINPSLPQSEDAYEIFRFQVRITGFGFD